jgi:hypothetical protein
MTAHNRKLKTLTFDLDGTEFQVQLNTWSLANGTADGETLYVYAPDEEFVDDSDPSYTLSATFYSDWRAGGISDFTWTHDGETLPFTIDHHPDIAAEHVQWTGMVKIKAPDVGGDVRTTEVTSVQWTVVGKPDFVRP